MALFSFFKPPKYKQFTYQPRYFKPEEEDLQERIKQSEKKYFSGKISDEEYIEKRISFRKNLDRTDNQQHAEQSQNTVNKTLIICFIGAIFIIIVAYGYLYTGFLGLLAFYVYYKFVWHKKNK